MMSANRFGRENWGVDTMAWTYLLGVVAVCFIAWGWLSDRAHH